MKKEILNYILEQKKNIIINGAISTGKTKAIAFPLVDKIIEKKENLLILDTKEEYANKYYNILKENKYNVITINLKDFDRSDSWNPLEYAYDLYKEGNIDRAIEYIENIGKIIFYEGSTVDPFWAKAATDLFIGLSLSLFKETKKEEINFESINNLLESFNKKFEVKDCLTTYFEKKEKDSIEYKYASASIFAAPETKNSIIAIIKQKITSYISSEKLSNLLNKTSFNYEDITSKPTVLFIITKEENNKYNELASIFIEQIFQILIDKENISTFNFILDNIDTIEWVENLNNMLSLGGRKNIKFYILTRSLEELNNKYSTYMNKLSNLIKLTNHTMKMTIEEEITINDNNLNINNNIKYPNTKKNIIEKFNLESHLNKDIKLTTPAFNSKEVDKLLVEINKKIEELEKEEKNKTIKSEIKKESFNSKDDDELLAKIDKRIAELEAEEKKNDNNKLKQKKANLKLDLLDNNKFSIDDLIAKIDEKIKLLDKDLEQETKKENKNSKDEKQDNRTTVDIINKINEKIKELESQQKSKNEEISNAEFQQFKLENN